MNYKRYPVLMLLFSMVSLFLIFTSNPVEATLDDPLYAGTTNPGIVYLYKGGTEWEAISPSLGWSVTSIICYEGMVYVAAITNPDVYSSSGLVYRYDGGTTWTLVGTLDNQVCFLIEYKGDLYAGTANGTARLYKYISPGSWDKVIEYTLWYGFRSAYVWNDWLYLGDWYYDKFARWDCTTFEDLGDYDGWCIYSFEAYGDYLYAGAYMGSFYRLTDAPSVTMIWTEPSSRYLWSLKAFCGYLYIGSDAMGTGVARLYKYDGTNFNVVWNYPTTTSNIHEGIISMETDGQYLYIGVGGQSMGYPGTMSGAGTGEVYRTLDGTTFDLISGTLGTGVETLRYCPPPLPPPVGGVWTPINKVELLAPWIGLASLITVATTSIVYVRYRKKKQP